jgi:plastocyanin
MVTFVASLVGAAAIFARVTSAVPMDYGAMSSSAASPSYTSGSSSYGNSYGSGSSGNSYGSGSSGNSYGSGSGYNNNYGSSSMSASVPSYTSSSASMPSYTSSSSSYGSGSSSWNNGGYDSCVQQCVAEYGAPSSMYMPPSGTSSGSSGSGTTHTVIVAPTQGVLRYVPFALNASVGDTVKFMWGANNHTVTKSSELALCNKTSDQPFASGEQNTSFVFTQVVNDTNPTFFYCGTPTHCEKGMFGIINPPNAYMQPSSASMMMPSLAGQYPSTQAAMSYASNMTASQPAAAAWGGNIDLSGVPDWAQSYAAENILFTQSFLASNPETINQAGDVDLSPLGSNAVMIPTDVAAAARQNDVDNSTSTASSGYPAASSTASGSTPSTTASGDSSTGSTNGAGAISSPRVAVALVAVAAAFFAL